jgi:hypothetical protein
MQLTFLFGFLFTSKLSITGTDCDGKETEKYSGFHDEVAHQNGIERLKPFLKSVSQNAQ